MQYIVSFVDFLMNIRIEKRTAHNTAYTLLAYAFALRDTTFGNVVYAGNVK